MAHTMKANPQVTGHLILYCEECGYSVQIEHGTLRRTTLEIGDAMTVPHGWSRGGMLAMGTAGSKTKPPDEPRPDTPGSCCPVPLTA